MTYKIVGWKTHKSRQVTTLGEAMVVLSQFGVDYSEFNIGECFERAQELVNMDKYYEVEHSVVRVKS